MYKGIIFDVDGTILNTRKASLMAAQKSIEKHLGETYPLEELEFTFGLPTEESAKRLGFHDLKVYCDATDEYYAIFGQKYNCVFDQIPDLLDILQTRGIVMGVITAKTRWEYDIDFDRFHLHSYFPVSITADDTLESKPSRQTVAKFLSITGLSSDEVLFVGDTHVDLACAHNGSVTFAFAGWCGGPTVSDADLTLQSPMDLLSLIRE